jgi:uncharacterized RDD family membrane protein YckC
MNDFRSNVWTQPQTAQALPYPLPHEALAGVRSRRIMAVCLDLIIVGFLAFMLWLVLGFLSLGLLWFILPPLFPIIAFVYNGMTISGWRMATPGMRMMDLEVRLMDGAPVPFINAAVHAVLFYLSWMFPVLFIVSLLASDKRCLHDMLANMIVLRRSH